MNVAVFASGGGTNFGALLEKKDSGQLHADFVLCVGNNSKAPFFDRARSRNIPCLHISPSHFTSEAEYAEKLLAALTQHGVECIVLAGYMKKIPSEIIKLFPNKILNIHPALLPSFGGKGLYGLHVHQAVIDYGAKISGVTVHFVDEEYDHGAVIIQRTCEVLPDDTAELLQKRVLAFEYDTYWRALEAVTSGAITVRNRRVYGIV